jgi:U3 small nucleolar RNA-associated protein 14
VPSQQDVVAAAMSSSDSEVEDPRFRIPRGASDEEIDSDDAYPDSEGDGECGASRNSGAVRRGGIPTGNGKLAKTGDTDDREVGRNEEACSEEGVLLSDMLCSHQDELGGESTDRVRVSAAAALLRHPNEFASVNGGAVDEVPISDDDDHVYFSDSSLGDEETPGHAELLEAATGRTNFANRRASRLEAADARRRARKVTAGGGEEGPLKAQPTRPMRHTDALALMMGALEGTGIELGELKRKIGKLVSGEPETRPLDAPVPMAISARVERSAAYQETREEISKWTPVVKRNRVAESLVFPLDRPGGQSSRTSRDVVSAFRSSNPFEHEIESLLVEAGVAADADVTAKEEEQLNAAASVVSKDEILARRRELARMRSVLFVHERKLKRIKKIKSRKFRKMMKIERERAAANGAVELGSDDDRKDSAFAAERQRVVERMTLRHKNTSRWVRRQLSRGEVKRNPASRAAVEDQLRLHEELRKKQESSAAFAGRASDSESDAGDDLEYRKVKVAFDDDKLEGNGSRTKGGLMGLKFMQQAQERRRQEALSLLHEIENSENGDVDPHGEDDLRLLNDLEYPGNRRAVTHGDIKAQSNDAPSGATRRERGKLVGRRVFDGQERTHGSAEEALPFHGKLDLQTGSDGNGEGSGSNYGKRIRVTKSYTAVLSRVIGDECKADAIPGYTTRLAGRIEANVNSLGDRPQAAAAESHTSQEPPNQGDVAASDVSKENLSSASQQLGAGNPWLAPVSIKCSDKLRDNAVHKLVVPLAGAGTSVVPIAEFRTSKGSAEGGLSTRKRLRFDETARNGGSATINQRRVDAEPCQGVRTNKAEPGTPSAKVVEILSPPDIAGKCRNTRHAALEQMETVAKAFAGAGGADLADFEAAKTAEIERTLPSAEDVGARILPGWGDWGGDQDNENGAKRRRGSRYEFANGGRPESSFAKAAREKLEAARVEAIAGRRDSQLRHVVISARRAKMASELTASTVPFPYSRADQWEREVATPVLRERLTHSELEKVVRPRVSTRKGDALQPLKMSASAKTELAQIRQLNIVSKGKSAVVKMRRERAVKRDEGRRGLLD